MAAIIGVAFLIILFHNSTLLWNAKTSVLKDVTDMLRLFANPLFGYLRSLLSLCHDRTGYHDMAADV